LKEKNILLDIVAISIEYHFKQYLL